MSNHEIDRALIINHQILSFAIYNFFNYLEGFPSELVYSHEIDRIGDITRIIALMFSTSSNQPLTLETSDDFFYFDLDSHAVPSFTTLNFLILVCISLISFESK